MRDKIYEAWPYVHSFFFYRRSNLLSCLHLRLVYFWGIKRNGLRQIMLLGLHAKQMYRFSRIFFCFVCCFLSVFFVFCFSFRAVTFLNVCVGKQNVPGFDPAVNSFFGAGVSYIFREVCKFFRLHLYMVLCGSLLLKYFACVGTKRLERKIC